jgi:hypothetical protein
MLKGLKQDEQKQRNLNKIRLKFPLKKGDKRGCRDRAKSCNYNSLTPFEKGEFDLFDLSYDYVYS